MISTIQKTELIGLAILGLSLPAASAMAADGTPSTTNAATSQSFLVKSAADAGIQNGAKAFKRGQIDRSIMYSNMAIKTGLSDRREAIAQTNLCAAYGAQGKYEKAKKACDTALKLRPEYAPAKANKAALTYQLARK